MDASGSPLGDKRVVVAGQTDGLAIQEIGKRSWPCPMSLFCITRCAIKRRGVGSALSSTGLAGAELVGHDWVGLGMCGIPCNRPSRLIRRYLSHLQGIIPLLKSAGSVHKESANIGEDRCLTTTHILESLTRQRKTTGAPSTGFAE